MFTIQPSTLANCLLVLLLHWSFDYKQVEKLSLLVAKLVVGVSSQLGLLSVRMILGPEIDKTV